MNSEIRKKIIEVYFPAKKISECGARERYIRKSHPYGAKTWWARRPLTALRAIIFASAVEFEKSKNSESYRLISELIEDISPSSKIIEKAKNLIKKSYENKTPRLLDFFSGGGGIPLEAARLGIDSYSLEINPVAVIIQKALLYAKKNNPRISKDVNFWGRVLIDRAEKSLNNFFLNPLRKSWGKEEPIVYFWSRTVKCPYCKKETPLSRLSYLAKRKKRMILIEFDPNKGSWITREHCNVNSKVDGRKKHQCLFCSALISPDYLKKEGNNKRIGEMLQAIAFTSPNYQGKRYVSSSEIDLNKLPKNDKIEEAIKSLGKSIDLDILKFPLKKWSGIVNPTVYGYYTIEEFFNKRQLLVLLTIVHELKKIYFEMLNDIGKDRADSVILILTSLVDHLVDWNSSFTMWIPQNEQCGRSLAGPGIPMLWDYIEINPFSSGPANLRDKLNRIVESIEAVPKLDHFIEIKEGTALNLPYQNDFFDLVVIDPPYYDSLFYSALSDLLFPWQKLTLEGTFLPPGSLTPLDEAEEVTASKYHKNGDENTTSFNKYEEMMTKALKEAYRVLKPNGILTVIYGHKTIEGWKAIANAILNSNFKVIKAWPLYMERKARPRAMKSDALASVMVLVLRKQLTNEYLYFSKDLLNKIRFEITQHFDFLLKDGWLGTDILMACIGQSLVYYTSNLVDKSGIHIDFEDYMKEINNILESIVYENPLIEKLDLETRIYLNWRRKFGEKSLTWEEFYDLCQYVNNEKLNVKKFFNQQKVPLFQQVNGKIKALRAKERELDKLLYIIPLNQYTYIDKVHLLISSKLYNDHRVNQRLEGFNHIEKKKIIATLMALAGVELTTLDSRRLEPEKLEARKLLSRLAIINEDKKENQLSIFNTNYAFTL